MATYTTVDEPKKRTTVNFTAGTSQVAHDDYDAQYNEAMGRVSQARQNMPTYNATYDQAVQDMFDDVMNYEKFSYNTRDDMLFQSYKQSYTAAGKRAMADAMGQAAGLTGGYGSSYSQTVGEQQYAEYLQKLNDVLPETYAMAYQQYRDEKDDLFNQYSMTKDMADTEYQRHQDDMDNYYRETEYWQGVADTAYDRKWDAEERDYQREQDAYEKKQKSKDNLADMIMNLGYVPTAEEMAAVGMSEREYQAYRNYYISNNAPAASGGGGGGRSRKKKNDPDEESNSAYDQVVSDGKRMVDQGASVEEVNGSIARNAAANGLTPEQAGEAAKEITNHAVNQGKI